MYLSLSFTSASKQYVACEILPCHNQQNYVPLVQWSSKTASTAAVTDEKRNFALSEVPECIASIIHRQLSFSSPTFGLFSSLLDWRDWEHPNIQLQTFCSLVHVHGKHPLFKSYDTTPCKIARLPRRSCQIQLEAQQGQKKLTQCLAPCNRVGSSASVARCTDPDIQIAVRASAGRIRILHD
ncbi:uncharacterized protein BJX67DRAFT_207450 [Aspergillus lucknowensis]|uniref:Uncharacterized protein n=1 Tax=Aspergillus lucknowensis TaxID=176173 RepID=A0ABR4LJG6_9EURO